MAENTIPNDPMILLSFVNTKLRDFYPSLDKCVTISVAVKKKLKASFLQLTTNTTQNSINLSDIKGKSVLSYSSFDMINI